MKRWSVLFLLVLLLSGCINRPEASKDPISYKYRSQEFEIHYYFQEYQSYMEQARDETSQNRQRELYEDTIVKSLMEDGVEERDAFFFSQFTSDFEELEKSIQVLTDDFNSIHKAIKQSLKESSKLLPSGDFQIYVLPSMPEKKLMMKEMNYVTGNNRENQIFIMIDPDFEMEALKYTVAHEYLKVAYEALPIAKQETLLELSVLEGKADAFAKSFYPNVVMPWTEPLEEPSGAEAWKVFMENKDQDPYYYSHFFSIVEVKDRQWSLHKIGSEIVNSFIERRPDVPVEEWTKMDAEELFEQSGLFTK